MDCSIAIDRAFGPSVPQCRRTFDFTLLFEETIFSIAPSALFLLIVILRLSVLWKRPSRVQGGNLYKLKLVTSALYASLQFCVLVEYCTVGLAKTEASIPSATLAFLASILLCIASVLEHTKSSASSFLPSFYLFTTILLDTVRIRTLWQIGELTALCLTFVAAFVAKLVLLVLESWSKRRYLDKADSEVAGEELAGFLSRSLFLWLNPLLVKGSSNFLTPPDLSPVDSALSSARLAKLFEGVNYTHYDLAPKYKLLLAAMKSLGWSAARPVLPRLLLTGFTFAQPFLVSSILDYLQNSTARPKNDGYGLLGACFLVYVGIAVLSGWYWQQTNRLTTMMRGVLISSIFSKTLKLSADADSESRAMTLMIADVEGVVGSLKHLNEVWASLIETALATWLLERQVGLASLSMIALVLVCTGLTLKLSKMAGPRQQAWFAAMQTRIKPTSQMLSSFKAVKMLGADERIRALIQSLRYMEIKAARPFRNLLVQRVVLSYITLTLSPVLVFGTFIAVSKRGGSEFDISRLFTSLILISLLATPLIYLFQMIPGMGAALGCLERIQKYLDIEERPDFREVQPSTRQSPSNGSDDEKAGGGSRSEGGKAMISITGASYSWTTTSRPVLKNVSLSIRRGEHIAVTGQVGSGKFLFLNAILGEAVQPEGSTTISTAEISYCAQTPWLENLSGIKTVLRSAECDVAWLKSVTWACALEDVKGLKEYAEGSIGTGGMILSGGQKQRLALARAIYSRKPILLLDDPFSALDKTTRNLISVRLFGSGGLLRRLGTTVIYTTYDEQFKGSADRVLEVDAEGGLTELPHQRSNLLDLMEISSVPKALPESKEKVLETATVKKASDSETNRTKLLIQDRTVYKTYFKSVGSLHSGLFLAGGVLFAFTLKFPDLWVQWWSETSYGPGSRSLNYWIEVYALLELLPILSLGAWITQIMHRVIRNSARSLHAQLLDTALRAPFPYISKQDIGSLLNRFNQDLMLIDTQLPLSILNTNSSLFTALMKIILITISVIYLLAVLPPLFLVLFLIQNFYLRTSKQLRHLDLESKAALHTKFLETCSGLTTIRAFNWGEKLNAEFLDLLDRSQEPFYLLPSVQSWLQLVLNLIVAEITILVLGVAISIERKVKPAAIGVAFLNATTLGETLTQFIVSWASLETSLGAIARISSFVKTTPREKEPAIPEDVSHDWPSRGGIEFKNVWASYDSNLASREGRGETMFCLKDINLSISPGEKVAVCGRTGSGKSSLVLALLSMLSLSSGSILIDGVDISHISLSTLRRRLNTVPQDVFALAKTNREELDSRGGVSDNEIIYVLERCGIWEKVLEEGGLDGRAETAKFSAGEAQLYCFARAVLKSETVGGGVVVIDEATSSVDEATEKKIHNLTVEMLRGKSVVSVLHRLETAVKYDKILVLDEGRVLDFGTPEEVISRCELFSAFRGKEDRGGDTINT